MTWLIYPRKTYVFLNFFLSVYMYVFSHILLGEKTFFMGDKPTELDCAAFGQLAQIRWATPDSCPGKSLMKGINPFLSNRIVHPYYLEESILHLRGIWCIVSFFMIFLIEITVCKQCRP